MQYLLTQSEYNALKKVDEERIYIHLTEKKFQTLCTKIADEMPVAWGWEWGEPDPQPWGCKITVEKTEGEWFCDACPVDKICRYYYKEYSK